MKKEKIRYYSIPVSNGIVISYQYSDKIWRFLNGNTILSPLKQLKNYLEEEDDIDLAFFEFEEVS